MRYTMIALKYILFCFLTFSSINLLAQNEITDENSDFEKEIGNRFAGYWYNLPQEKVYLHTDKPYYSAGENIWFKAYLVNAATHFNDARSQFVYVELINQVDSVISRVKIKKDSIGFSGHISLNPELNKGNYVLRAYTNWMRNISDDFFFKKNIYIGNDIDDRISCQANYETQENGKILVKLTFTNTFHNPVTDKKVAVEQSWLKGRRARQEFITDDKGNIRFEIESLPDETSRKYLAISIKEPGLDFSHTAFIPDFTDDFDIQFFPESGALLGNCIQTVAFKAIGRDGLSVDVSGKLYDNDNEEISAFSSLHNGMGKIIIGTQPGKSYYAVVTSAKGREKTVQLPAVRTEGIGLQLIYNTKGNILYQVFNKTNIPTESLFLLVHWRGIAGFVFPLAKPRGMLPEELFPEGIISFSVIDSEGKTYCERLYFSRNFVEPTVAMKANKKRYGKREKVMLDFNVTSNSGEAFDGNFSISVTDEKMIKNDSLSDHIKSYLLFTSDLKGYIETPGAYFTDNSFSTREKTDILMLTQGWKRFNTADLALGKINMPKYYLEAGQTISGKVVNVFGRSAKNNDVFALFPQESRFSVSRTDSLGNFLIEGIEFADSTNIVLKANSKTKIVDVEIIPDKDEFPAVNVFIPNRIAEAPPAPTEYFQMIKEKYYTEGGMLVVGLNEITIKAPTKSKTSSNVYSGFADTKIESDRIEQFKNTDIMILLSSIAGVRVSGQSVSIRGNTGSPLFLLDGMEIDDIDEIRNVQTSDIEEIDVFKGASASIFGSRGGNGVISITTKEGTPNRRVQAPSITSIMPLGFQKPEEFYVPRYEVDSIRLDSKADLRTTIYWNPKLVSDSMGNVQLDFYTADKANNYRIIFEGISKTGEICRYEDFLIREN